MNNPGLHNLGDVAVAAINAATVATVVTAGVDGAAHIDGLDGILSATIQANFNYGSSGGTSLKAIVETTLDDGQTWIEVARFAFTTASAEKIANLSALTPVTTVYTPAALSDDAVKDGILGPRWRARILTVGTYVGNASLALRLAAH
ncbi:MAG: hypothetical protein KF723_22155 [Rhizobiaceae bacterium]|nr:hypothetical protein [Rhizobiaceae bacterium]